MKIIIILTVSMIVLLLLPLVLSYIYYKRRKGEILHINQAKTRDMRFFGKSFASLIERGMKEGLRNHYIKLSKTEKYLDEEQLRSAREEVDDLIIAKSTEFRLPKQIKVCTKEIYAEGDMEASGEEELSLRAAYSKGNMIIGNKTEIVRWVDAEGTLAVYDQCDLGISATSATAMSVGKGCRFHRLYAPEIYLGQYPDEKKDAKEGKDPAIYRMPVQMQKEKNRRSITSEMINENGVVEYSVLTWHNLKITEGIIVQGDVRSHKGVRLCKDAVVCGNVFAESDVYLEKNACVLGNLFSQGSIYLEEGAVAGQEGRVCSVIARENITFEGNNFVFGYVNCEGTGKIAEVKEPKERELMYFPKPVREKHLRFVDLYDYEHVDQQGFRFRKELLDVEIPEGATAIPKSMFYFCENMEEAILPETIEEIGGYSFAECRHLKKINLRSLTGLRKIGTSAFENCESLEEVELPATLQEIGAAAFSGCTNLKKVIFPERAQMKKIPDHCFRGCKNLEMQILPASVEYMGISSFRDCPCVPEIEKLPDSKEEVEDHVT